MVKILRSNMDGSLLTKADIRRVRPRGYALHDITDQFNELLFPFKIPSWYISFAQMGILGRPGTGKSVLLASLASLAHERYGDLLNVVYADALPLAVERMDHRPVQLLLVDDASGEASGRRSMSAKNVETTQDLNTLRHRLKALQEEAGVDMGGMVIVIMAWQREKDLEKSLRQADYRIWKTPPMDFADRQDLERQIGRTATETLNNLSYRILHGDNSAKAVSVASIVPIGLEAGGVGLYRMPMTDYRLPPIIRQADVERAEAEKTPATGARIDGDAVRLLRENGFSAKEIADLLGCSRQTVYRKLRETDVT